MIWPFRQSSPPERGPLPSHPCKHKEIVDDHGGYVMRNNACVLPPLTHAAKQYDDDDDCEVCGAESLSCDCEPERVRKNPKDIVDGDFYVCGVCKQVWVVSGGYWEISDRTEHDLLVEDG